MRGVVLGAVLGVALAQGEGSAIPTDIASWFTSTAALGAVVAALVALIRKHILKGLEGLQVVGLSLVLGVLLAWVGKVLGYLGDDWVVFGLGAGLIASGGTDYLRGLVGGNAKASGDTRTDASRSRLR